jgi:hypothetical protein
MNWLPYFRKEMEKTAIPFGSIVNTAFNVMDLNSTSKERLSQAKLTPLRQQAQALQLPGSNSFQFEGSKRIDSTANQTSEMY